jgi:hypothetical protein
VSLEVVRLTRYAASFDSRVSAVAAALATALIVSPAAAAPKDAQAEKAITVAMDTDYLQTSFNQAEKKLRAAIDACGDSGCTPAIKAKVYIALGTVLAGGKKELEDAREAFVEALKLDNAAKPDPDLVSSEITYAFERARKELKLDSGPSSPSSGGLTHTPVTEQRVRTPLPLFVEIDAEVLTLTRRVTASYLTPGDTEWQTLVMKKVGERGFGINVPCDEITKEGALKYYLTVTTDAGAILAGVGTRAEPLTTEIKATITGEPPHWPGFAPPDLCREVEEGPKQCLDDRQCNEAFQCVSGECVAKTVKLPEPEKKGFLNWVTLTLEPSTSFFSGEGVCSVSGQESNNFVCLREDGSRYTGVPTTDIANNVNPGFTFSSLRVALSYERVLFHNFTAGLRLGFGFLGGIHDNVSFFPMHIEARGAFWIGSRPFERKGVRPFVFVSGGAAQYNSVVQVQVLEDGAACGADPSNIDSPCTKPSNREQSIEKRLQYLDAYKQAGLGFASVGGGMAYAVLDRVSFNVAVRVGLTFPVVTLVIAPEAGLSFGF